MVLDTSWCLGSGKLSITSHCVTPALGASAFELARHGRAQRLVLNWRRLEAEGVGHLCFGGRDAPQDRTLAVSTTRA